MVHALEEIWRVLAPAGILIDLRPHDVHPVVEIVTGGKVMFAGLVDDTDGQPIDRAADAAIAQVIDVGLYVCEYAASFDFATYWDTPADLLAHAQARWNTAVLPAAVLSRVERLMTQLAEPARVRARRKMALALHRKRRA